MIYHYHTGPLTAQSPMAHYAGSFPARAQAGLVLGAFPPTQLTAKARRLAFWVYSV